MTLSESNRLFKDTKEQTENELIAFQSAFLGVLTDSESVEEILLLLNRIPVSSELKGYIESFEPRMVEIARELTQKWGKRQNKESI